MYDRGRFRFARMSDLGGDGMNGPEVGCCALFSLLFGYQVWMNNTRGGGGWKVSALRDVICYTWSAVCAAQYGIELGPQLPVRFFVVGYQVWMHDTRSR